MVLWEGQSPRRKFSERHASERPLNASEVARAADIHRGTAYNILRTLHAAGFVGYDEATRTYAVSLHILELAYGILRRSGLIDIARPLIHVVSHAHGVTAYLSTPLRPSSLLLSNWVGGALRSYPHLMLGGQLMDTRNVAAQFGT